MGCGFESHGGHRLNKALRSGTDRGAFGILMRHLLHQDILGQRFGMVAVSPWSFQSDSTSKNFPLGILRDIDTLLVPG